MNLIYSRQQKYEKQLILTTRLMKVLKTKVEINTQINSKYQEKNCNWYITLIFSLDECFYGLVFFINEIVSSRSKQG